MLQLKRGFKRKSRLYFFIVFKVTVQNATLVLPVLEKTFMMTLGQVISTATTTSELFLLLLILLLQLLDFCYFTTEV